MNDPTTMTRFGFELEGTPVSLVIEVRSDDPQALAKAAEWIEDHRSTLDLSTTGWLSEPSSDGHRAVQRWTITAAERRNPLDTLADALRST